jgi:hypothetical protein
MIDRYAPGKTKATPIAQPEVPDGVEVRAAELSTLHLNRDERLASERSAA